MINCANCGRYGCRTHDLDKTRPDCPMLDEASKEIYEFAFSELMKEENNRFFIECSKIEKDGYLEWPRLKETIELCKRMGYKKVGLAFCIGLKSEAMTVAKLFKEHGIELVSAICKTGSVPKQAVGIPDSAIIRPNDKIEPMCNPIAQAKFFEKEKTEFNIVLGLCVGHDSMFYKYSHTFTTTLVVKDRVLAHNPVGAIYQADAYYKTKLKP